ncbi:cell envelope integrity protein CreD [Pseudoxanthomonas kalamensis DSM 18571]|uniref:cell envelope integrity protein CreD n=1 Tax=Pseudoxanthomonas kalamensis TaxID=289483 RepID=UPI001390FEA3|nr:cell envelope integrity protein CreD [Pseudoxanthomonas kalamensis]KAF1710416.1 cell envelope integrity protein CreD [Pseudoxanthomonas kalamensis DSM 18571]
MKSLKLLLRFLIIGGLVILLLVPLTLIRGTIHERESYRNEASDRVARSTAGAQRVLGPLRAVPWTDIRVVEYTDDKGVPRKRTEKSRHVALQAPLELKADGRLAPETRKVGLFEVRVYTWTGTLHAVFDDALPPLEAGASREYGTPYLLLGVSDVRGLVGTPRLSVDGQALKFVPGSRDFDESISGVSAELPAVAADSAPGKIVDIELALAGTESFAMVPVADSNHIALASDWPHPSFAGDFLPTTRNVHPDGSGFEADWQISSLASQAQGQLQRLGDENHHGSLDQLHVSLVDPIDVYTQADRASKYGILFVVLTFVGFALFELIKRLPIHPLQYLLVGLALAVFFLLLLSLSEHIEFWKAYVVSAVACIGLQFVYLSGVLKSWLRAAGFAAMLTALYGVLYSLLVSEDNALLMGSLLLFGILSAIMWITRKVDWYALGSSLR